MKHLVHFFAVVMAAGTFFVADAEARRLGGGGFIGRQSGGVTQRQAAPPAGQGASQAQPAAPRPNPATAPQPAGSRWLAPLAGLAAGLGLAALASYLGFGEELASLMLAMLLAFAAVVVVRMIIARRAGARPAVQGAYSSAGVGSEASVRYAPIPEQPAFPAAQPGAFGAGAAASAGEGGANFRIPADFDVDAFVRNAKVQFVRLQAAFDASDLNDLREFTSPEMFAELKMQIAERGASPNRTDVVQLDAELLGIESSERDHLASVRFHGLIREVESAPAHAFDEVWNLSKPAQGAGGWVLAGIQQLN
ncbi:MAG TPA: TIM44-like domain-containing protein [Burkholderiaceae bacterium]